MVVGPPHSVNKHWLQTTSCCSDGNWWVVSDDWKPFYWDWQGMRQGGERKQTIRWGVVSKSGHIRTRVLFVFWDNGRRNLYCCLLGVRRRGGTNLSQALLRNVRSRRGMLRENTKRWHVEVESTDVHVCGRPLRSSDEVSVMGIERRGWRA